MLYTSENNILKNLYYRFDCVENGYIATQLSNGLIIRWRFASWYHWSNALWKILQFWTSFIDSCLSRFDYQTLSGIRLHKFPTGKKRNAIFRGNFFSFSFVKHDKFLILWIFLSYHLFIAELFKQMNIFSQLMVSTNVFFFPLTTKLHKLSLNIFSLLSTCSYTSLVERVYVCLNLYEISVRDAIFVSNMYSFLGHTNHKYCIALRYFTPISLSHQKNHPLKVH